jgi:hypothetical protein
VSNRYPSEEVARFDQQFAETDEERSERFKGSKSGTTPSAEIAAGPVKAGHFNLSERERGTLETRLNDLMRFLGAPGDWGYGTPMADLTLYLLNFREQLNRA